MRMSVGIFKESAGLFDQDKWKSIVEAIVNLVASIVLGIFIGLNGIILGTIISVIGSFVLFITNIVIIIGATIKLTKEETPKFPFVIELLK
jgi:uncharacterized Tic20 family protein